MIRIRSLLEISQVATRTVLRCAGKPPIHVTLRTLHAHVGSSQRETGHRVVIERRARPSRCRVALLARRWEASRYVIRISGFVEIRLVATDARSRRAFVLTIDVTLRAHQRLVRTRQREPSRRVIELSACPCCRVVTLRTRIREPGGNVVGILRIVEVWLVTIHAI